MDRLRSDEMILGNAADEEDAKSSSRSVMLLNEADTEDDHITNGISRGKVSQMMRRRVANLSRFHAANYNTTTQWSACDIGRGWGIM
jgi:hypothetical protein